MLEIRPWLLDFRATFLTATFMYSLRLILQTYFMSLGNKLQALANKANVGVM